MPPRRLHKVYPVGSSLASIRFYRDRLLACAKSGLTKNVTFCPKIGRERRFGGCHGRGCGCADSLFSGAGVCFGVDSDAAGGVNATVMPACRLVGKGFSSAMQRRPTAGFDDAGVCVVGRGGILDGFAGRRRRCHADLLGAHVVILAMDPPAAPVADVRTIVCSPKKGRGQSA